MPLGSSLSVTLPPQISSSFWTFPDYRPGAVQLYLKLQSGLQDNSSILSLIRHRIQLEYSHAESLSTPAPFNTLSNPLINDSNNNQTAAGYLKIIHQETTSNQANAHNQLAANLERNILLPFGKWSEQHEGRVRSSWEHLDAALTRFARQKQEVERLRSTYESKCRQADEAEDDARFAPSSNDIEGPPTPEKSNSSIGSKSPPPISSPTPTPTNPEALKRRETLRQQFGFQTKGRKSAPEASSNSTSTSTPPRKTEFGGVNVPTASPDDSSNEKSHTSTQTPESPAGSGGFGSGGLSRSTTLSSYLSSAVTRLNDAPALAPIRGALGGLTEPKHLRIRREAENAEMSYSGAVRTLDRNRCALEEILMEHYGLAMKWEGDRQKAVKSVLDSYQAAFAPLLPALSNSLTRSHQMLERFNPDLELSVLIGESRTGSYRPKPEVFHAYYHDSTDPASLAGAGASGFGMNLINYARADALAKEELAEAEGTAGKSPSATNPTTGPDHFLPLVLTSLLKALDKCYDDPSRWPLPSQGEDSSSTLLFASSEKRKAWVYDVPLVASHKLREAIISLCEKNSPGLNTSNSLETLLDSFDPPVLAATIKLWALELEQSLVMENLWEQIDNVYRAAIHQEREALKKLRQESLVEESKTTPTKATTDEEKKEDEAPLKTLAEKKGKGNADQKVLKVDQATEEKIRKETLDDLNVVLGKLPKIHLMCLDALIGHLSKLVKATPTDEPEIKYLNKLGLSLGRAIIRPPSENSRTLSSKAPALLIMDLIHNYSELFPALIGQKAKESESAAAAARKMPVRKRTKPIDQRMSRSQMQKDHAAAQAGFKALRQAQDQSLGAGAGIPLPPNPVAKEESSKPVTAPIITTQKISSNQTASPSAMKDAELPTPLSTRVLGGGLPGNTPAEITGTNVLSIERTASPAGQSAGGSSTYGSAQGDSSPKILSPEIKPASPSVPAAATALDSTSYTSPKLDEDKPLSNVARLSRQFGSSSSTGVRGPRPAGGRAGRVAATEGTENSVESKRESKDLRPDTDENSLVPDRQRRRRSWSRSVEPSDALVDGDGNEGSEG